MHLLAGEADVGDGSQPFLLGTVGKIWVAATFSRYLTALLCGVVFIGEAAHRKR